MKIVFGSWSRQYTALFHCNMPSRPGLKTAPRYWLESTDQSFTGVHQVSFCLRLTWAKTPGEYHDRCYDNHSTVTAVLSRVTGRQGNNPIGFPLCKLKQPQSHGQQTHTSAALPPHRFHVIRSQMNPTWRATCTAYTQSCFTHLLGMMSFVRVPVSC